MLFFFVVVASAILGFEGEGSFLFNRGSVFVLAACVCWGVENNCTRSISTKSSEEIVLIKGIFSGLGSIVVAFAAGESLPSWTGIGLSMLLGFVSYGLSINFYILAQKQLGAAKTSAFYSMSPFFGVGFSFLLLRERPALRFYVGLAIMLVATAVMAWDTLTDGRAEGGS